MFWLACFCVHPPINPSTHPSTQACRVPLDHDTPLPHAVVEAAAAGGDSKQAAVSGSGGFGYPPPHPKQPPSKT